MESIKGSVRNKTESEWSIYTKSSFNEVSERSNINTSEHEDLKIKVEIELKEETNGLIYQPDFYGHLRLVSLNQNIPSNSAIENKYSALPAWQYLQPASDLKETSIVPIEHNGRFGNDCVYGEMKNVSYDISSSGGEKSTTNNFQNLVSELPEMYNYAFESTQQQQPSKSIQVPRKQRNRQHPIILAEKKREYRMRIKEENPNMWCAMKQKEACKKREQREERRLILLEMQKLKQLVTNSPEVENYKLYLEALKERYPEIWKQLIDALSAAEQRDQELKNEKSSKRRLLKPVKMYKDVVEAQKKYLYRQRMKLERPDLYEQQKARDSCARSLRRMLKKKLSETQNNVNN